MALGGIPVSSGISGNGTLIGVNLLYSPLLYVSNVAQARPVYALGGTAGAAGYEATYAKDKDQMTYFKAAASTSEETFTMIHGASPPTVYGCVIVNHNIYASTTTTLKFEGGNDTNYNTVSEDMTINSYYLTPIYHLLASPQPYDHWRIRVQFNTSRTWLMGEVFLIGAPPLAFARNYDWGGLDEIEYGVARSDGGICGVPRVETVWERRRKEFQFTRISATQLEAMQAMVRNGHVIFSPDGANGYAYFGVLELEPPVPVFVDQWDVKAKFTECSR